MPRVNLVFYSAQYNLFINSFQKVINNLIGIEIMEYSFLILAKNEQMPCFFKQNCNVLLIFVFTLWYSIYSFVSCFKFPFHDRCHFKKKHRYTDVHGCSGRTGRLKLICTVYFLTFLWILTIDYINPLKRDDFSR